MQEYEIGQSLTDIRTTKQKMDAYAQSLLQSVPADDPFAKKAADAELMKLAEDYAALEDAEIELADLSKSLLATGKVRNEGPTMIPAPGPEGALAKAPPVKDKIRAHVGFALGIEPDKIDMDSGAPFTTRMKAAFFSAEKKPDFYKSEFGEENVVTLNIDGKPANFIKQGDKLILADEQDFTAKDVADIFGGVASEVLPTAGAIAGGVLGAPSVPGAAIASGAGYTAGGTISDSIAQAVFMNDENQTSFGDTLGKRSLEGMGTMPLDMLAMRLVTPTLAKRLGPAAKREQAVMLADEAARNLEKRGRISSKIRKRVEPLIEADFENQIRLLQVGQKRKNSTAGRGIYSARDSLQEFRDLVAAKESGIPKKMYEASAKRFFYDQEVAIARIGEVNGALAARMKKELDQKVAVLMGDAPPMPEDQLGTTIRNLAQEAEQHAIKSEREAYDSIFDEADTMGVAFQPAALANIIESEYKQRRFQKSSVVEGVIADLRAAKDGAPITAREMHSLIKKVRHETPMGFMVAPTDAQYQARVVSGKMNEIFKEQLGSANLGGKWDTASGVLQERMKFEGGALSAILKDEAGGGAKMTDFQIVDKVLSDPTHSDKVISALPTDLQPNMRLQLQQAYLRKIGIGRDIGTGQKAVDFDESMVRKLWGVNKYGRENEEFGKLMVDKIKVLNSEIKKLQADPSKVSDDGMMALQDVLSADGIKETTQLIAKRAAERTKAEVAENNEIIKLALSSARQGNMSVMDLDAFPRAVFEERNTGRVAELVNYMDAGDLEAFKANTMGHFFRRYAIESVANKNAFGFVPWDAGKFLLDIETNPALAANLKKVVGADGLDDLVEYSNLALTVRPVVIDKQVPLGVRTVANPEKVSIYIAGDIPKAIRSEYLSAAYTAGQLMPAVRKTLGRRVSVATYEENMRKMNAALFGTARGMEAAFLAGRRSPGFIEWYSSMGLGPDWAQEEKDFRQQYGTEKRDFLPK